MENFVSKCVNKNIKTVIIALLCTMTLYAEPYKRMVMIFDPDGAETPSLTNPTPHVTLQTSLALGIAQKSYAILTSSTQLKMLSEKIATTPQNPPDLTLKLFLACKFTIAEWDIYHIPNSELFLLIPENKKDFYKQTIRLPKKKYTLGALKTAELTKFEKPTLQELSSWVTAQKSLMPIPTAEALKKVFFTKNDIALHADLLKELDEFEDQESKIDYILSEFAPWIFFINGHGSFADQLKGYIGSIAGLLQDELNDFLEFLNTQLSVSVAALSSCYAGGKNIEMLTHKKDIDGLSVARNLHFILAVLSIADTETTGSYSLFHDGTINWPNTEDFEKFFTAIENQDQKNLNWLSEALIAIAQHLKDASNIPQILIPGAGWVQAFSPALINTTWAESLHSKGKKTPKFKLDEKRKSWISIQTKLWEEERKKIIILNNVFIQKHIIEKKPIILKEEDTSVILYPKIIAADIEISPKSPYNPPKFIPMKPVHIFKKIIIKLTSFPHLIGSETPEEIAQNYMGQYFVKINNRSQKNFFIQELSIQISGKPNLDFKNLIVQINFKDLSKLFPTSCFFNKDQSIYGKELQKYLEEMPTWKRELKTKSDLQVKLEDLSGKLLSLNGKLKELKETLTELQNSLQGKASIGPKPAKPIAKEILTVEQKEQLKKWNAARIKLHPLIWEWIKRSRELVFSVTEQEITNYIQLISQLPTEDKINAAKRLINKIPRKKLPTLATKIAAQAKADPSNSDLVALSIQIAWEFFTTWDNDSVEIKQWFTKHNDWINSICHETYFKIVLPQQKSKILPTKDYYLASQLCIFFGSYMRFNGTISNQICRDLLPIMISRTDATGKPKDFISDATVAHIANKITNSSINDADNYTFVTTDPTIKEIVKKQRAQ